MTLVRMDKDEMYPVYYIGGLWGIETDIPQTFIDEWEAVDLQWHSLQNKLEDYYVTANKAKILETSKNGIQPKGF